MLCRLSEVTHSDVTDAEAGFVSSLGRRRDSPSSIAKPVRPVEFSLWVAIPFINLFVLLAVMLGVVYGKARISGRSIHGCSVFCGDHLTCYRSTAAFQKLYRTEHSRELHSNSYRNADRTDVDTDQSTSLHVATA
jgi:hypothetical protein